MACCGGKTRSGVKHGTGEREERRRATGMGSKERGMKGLKGKKEKG